MKLFLLLLTNIITIQTISAQTKVQIYDQGPSWVYDERTNIEFDRNGIALISQFPNGLDPNTIIINGKHEILSTEWIPEKTTEIKDFIDKPINVYTVNGDLWTGTLKSVQGSGFWVEKEGKATFFPDISKYRLELDNSDYENLKSGLKLYSNTKSDKDNLALMYQISGLSWSGETIVKYDPNNNSANVTVWANISNRSQASFSNISLSLVTGDISNQSRFNRDIGTQMYMAKAESVPSIEPNESGDMHIYKIEGATDLKDSPISKILLNNKSYTLQAHKKYIFNANYVYEHQKAVSSILIVSPQISKQKELVLPAGTVQIFEYLDEGLQYVAKNVQKRKTGSNQWEIELGSVSDIRIEQKQIRSVQNSKNIREETFEFTIINDKTEDIEIEISKRLGNNWNLENKREGWDILNSTSVRQGVSIKKESTKTILLSIKYIYP